MACHLACPTCHAKFFKISNMSIQRDNLRRWKPKKSISNELEEALQHNLQLEKENTALRAEIHDLAIKNDSLLQALNQNKLNFDGEFSKLQQEIRCNEKQLLDNSKKCLEQQKKSSEENKKLKHENETLKKEKCAAEISFTERMKSLESQIKLIQLDNANLRSCNKENQEACMKYKRKLSNAVKVVNRLNEIIAKQRKTAENVCETTQTDYIMEKHNEKQVEFDCSQCGDSRYDRARNSENLLLSDIFFKPKAFLDNEIELFSAKSKTKCISRNIVNK